MNGNEDEVMGMSDTIKLLKECDSGTKMAVSSIDEVLDKVYDEALKKMLSDSKDEHEILGNQIHDKLSQHGMSDKEPNALAKSMSWMKTNMKLTMNESDKTIADLITDGCDMGIKSLHRYQNQYMAADNDSKNLCDRIIKIEEDLRRHLQCYL